MITITSEHQNIYMYYLILCVCVLTIIIIVVVFIFVVSLMAKYMEYMGQIISCFENTNLEVEIRGSFTKLADEARGHAV